MAIPKENYRFFNMRNFRSGLLAGRVNEMARLEKLGVVPDIGAPTGVFEYTGNPLDPLYIVIDNKICRPILAEQVVFLIELLSVAWCPWVPYGEEFEDEDSRWLLGLSSVTGTTWSMCYPIEVPDTDSPVKYVYGWRLPEGNNSGIIVFHRDSVQNEGSSSALIGHTKEYKYDSNGVISCETTWDNIVQTFVENISAKSAGDVSIWGKLYSQENT